jgi:hypothetical protein
MARLGHPPRLGRHLHAKVTRREALNPEVLGLAAVIQVGLEKLNSHF